MLIFFVHFSGYPSSYWSVEKQPFLIWVQIFLQFIVCLGNFLMEFCLCLSFCTTSPGLPSAPTWTGDLSSYQVSALSWLLVSVQDRVGFVTEGWDHQLSSVQLLSRVRLFVTPWISGRQASLSITDSRSLLKHMSIESVMPSSHLILCHTLLLLPPIPPSIRVFSSESTLRMRWPKHWSFSFRSVLPMNTQDCSLLGWTGWISLLSKGLSRVFYNTTAQKHQLFDTQFSSQPNSHIHTWPMENP